MIVAAVAILLALPLIAFRARTLRLSIALQIALYIVGAIAMRQVPGFDSYLAAAALFVAQLAVFSLLLATAPADEVRWSANRAAVIALLVYALIVPAMLRTPIDGDEPFYLLMTESMVHDRDLDLRNQFRDLAHSATGRTDLVPQFGDPVGPHGEQYSRHEPFLPLLLIPGYLIAKLVGALATIVLFGVLLVRSTVRWVEDEGIDDATTRAVFPFFAFAPPILFYATRIWPEVPAAFCVVEAIRGVRAARTQRWIPALIFLSLLKLRFLLVALPLAVIGLAGHRIAGWVVPPAEAGGHTEPGRFPNAVTATRRPGDSVTRRFLVLCAFIALCAIPLAIAWLSSGSATSVHSLRELLPEQPHLYAIGFFGLILDGATGFLFQAPFYLIGILAVVRWRDTPRGFRLGILASLLYILYLVPRAEWHGGWAPPLRYVVVFIPVLALGSASMWRWINRGVIALIAIWTLGLVVHGVAFPYRLFHIENGENVAGEALSKMYHSDFSRLFPSFVRMNEAAIVAGVMFVVFCIAFMFFHRISGSPGYRVAGLPSGGISEGNPATWKPGNPGQRVSSTIVISIAACALAAMFVAGQQPGRVVELEDAHVVHASGELFPAEYTVARFLYRGGWVLHAKDSLSFLSRGGSARLDYSAAQPVLLDVGGRTLQLQATGSGYGSMQIALPRGRVTFRCLSGSVNLDSLTF